MLKPIKSIWLMHAEAERKAKIKNAILGLAVVIGYTLAVAWITSLFIN